MYHPAAHGRQDLLLGFDHQRVALQDIRALCRIQREEGRLGGAGGELGEYVVPLSQLPAVRLWAGRRYSTFTDLFYVCDLGTGHTI